MGNQKRYGLFYERKEKHYWEAQGFTVLRSRGSFGSFDLLLASKMDWRLVSVKSTKQTYYSYSKELKKIDKFTNAPEGTTKMLVLYHKGKRKVLYQKRIKKICLY